MPSNDSDRAELCALIECLPNIGQRAPFTADLVRLIFNTSPGIYVPSSGPARAVVVRGIIFSSTGHHIYDRKVFRSLRDALLVLQRMRMHGDLLSITSDMSHLTATYHGHKRRTAHVYEWRNGTNVPEDDPRAISLRNMIDEVGELVLASDWSAQDKRLLRRLRWTIEGVLREKHGVQVTQ
jgi:hypothetical protein